MTSYPIYLALSKLFCIMKVLQAKIPLGSVIQRLKNGEQTHRYREGCMVIATLQINTPGLSVFLFYRITVRLVLPLQLPAARSIPWNLLVFKMTIDITSLVEEKLPKRKGFAWSHNVRLKIQSGSVSDDVISLLIKHDTGLSGGCLTGVMSGLGNNSWESGKFLL